MKLKLQAEDMELDAATLGHAEKRAKFALSRFAGAIRGVSIRIRDINGPRGGVDKQCHVEVHMDKTSDVHIAEQGADLRSLIDRALHRAAHSVMRQLTRGKRRGQAAKRLILDDNEALP